jgi:hypothetical protein
MGYSGIILCYGREITVSSSNTLQRTGSGSTESNVEIAEWETGNLKTLDMIGEGDWLGIKYAPYDGMNECSSNVNTGLQALVRT